jgi:hypothetical protein
VLASTNVKHQNTEKGKQKVISGKAQEMNPSLRKKREEKKF